MRESRSGLARMQVVLIIAVIVVAAGVGAYAILGQGSSGTSGSTTNQDVPVAIRETDPVNQIDNFDPQNVTVKQGVPVTLIVSNGDDEVRVMTIADLNVNLTIDAGTTQRFAFTPTQAGTFKMYSPQTVPSAVSNGKPGSPCTGYMTVTP